MRVTLLTKIMGLVVVAVTLVGGGNYAANRYFLSSTLDEQNVKDIGIKADLVADQFENQKKSLIANGFLMATNPHVVKAITEGDSAWLQNYAKKVMAETGLESITISDREGKCVARGLAVGSELSADKYELWACVNDLRSLDLGVELEHARCAPATA